MTIKWKPGVHPHEDVFEDYVFDRLGRKSGDFEEHLLVCEECQHTLAKTDEYVRLVKAATAAYVAPRGKNHGLLWNAAAAAVLLLTFLTALLSWRTPLGDPKAISLEAYRSGSLSSFAQCPAGQPLNLNIDLTDVQPAVGYRVEVVDATGRRVWFGGTPARLTKGLAPGTYWVRLSTDTGEPLREFGLTAAK